MSEGTVGNDASSHVGSEEKKQLWKSILADVSSSSRARQLPKRNVVVLGDEGSGKSSLIARLQHKKYNSDDQPLGTGLEYTYLDVKEEDAEDVVGRLGVYTLDGDTAHADLLKFVCSENQLDQLSFLICLDFSKPWTIMDCLNKWLNVIEQQISPISSSETFDNLKQSLKLYVQKFGEDPESASDADTEFLPLEQGVLTTNFGIPIIVVLTKCDSIASLRKDYEMQGQHFDFIQMKVREVCMGYGAALVYQSRTESNTDRLYRYLLHRAYNFPLKDEPDITRAESTFIPSAWDSQAKIDVLKEGLKTINPEDPFDQAIHAPIKKTYKEEEIEVQNEQEFLRQQQGRLGRSAASLVSAVSNSPKSTTTASTTPATTTSAASKTRSSRTGKGVFLADLTSQLTKPSKPSSTSSTTPASSSSNMLFTKPVPKTDAPATDSAAKKPASPGSAKTSAAPQHDVIHNFFHSLLQSTPQQNSGGKS